MAPQRDLCGQQEAPSALSYPLPSISLWEEVTEKQFRPALLQKERHWFRQLKELREAKKDGWKEESVALRPLTISRTTCFCTLDSA